MRSNSSFPRFSGSRRRRGIASIVGTVLFVLVMLVAFGTQTYVTGLQAQSDQIAQAAQQAAQRRSNEVVLFSGSGPSSLSVTNYGESSSVITTLLLKYPNGTIFRLSLSVGVQLPLGANAALQPLVPAQACGSTTCLAKYNSLVSNAAPQGSLVGVATGYGNTFWYGPSESIVNWSNVTNFPNGCSSNQFVTSVGTTVTCTQVGWAQLTGYPSSCAAGQFVLAVGSTLTCSQVGWSQVGGFPAACPSGQFVAQIAATPACGTPSGSMTKLCDATLASAAGSVACSALAPYVHYSFEFYTPNGCSAGCTSLTPWTLGIQLNGDAASDYSYSLISVNCQSAADCAYGLSVPSASSIGPSGSGACTAPATAYLSFNLWDSSGNAQLAGLTGFCGGITSIVTGKWTSSSQVSSITVFIPSGSDTMAAGTELVVWGVSN